jgi:N-acetylmuramoyl-L-alanine amidase
MVLIPQFTAFAAQALTMNYDGKKVMYSGTIYKINLDGKEVETDFPGIIFNKVPMFPVRAVFEELGGKVVWNSKAQLMDVTYNGLKLQFKNNNAVAKIETKSYKLATQAKKMNDRLIVPVDFIKNIKGLTAIVDNKAKVINIKVLKTAPVDSNDPDTQKPDEETPVSTPVKENNTPLIKKLNSQITYVSNQDRIYFAFKDIALTDTGSKMTKYFSYSYDEENKKYTITIPEKLSKGLSTAVFSINDSLVDTVVISKDSTTSETNIVFSVKKDLTFYTSYNEDLHQTEVNLLTPATESESLVVIDAGHGGIDPGASGGKILEKNVNLDISLKLNEMLKKRNIKTFMLRQDDTFVGLYDRPYIANALNATLFLSIHNNSFSGSSANGTETLYFPEKAGDTSFTGQKFAKLLQNSLMNSLDTYNRKTVSRPGLVVLKYTHMPSSLAEIGFLTNAGDLKRLTDEAFQTRTAQALCNAIVQALNQLEKEKQLD